MTTPQYELSGGGFENVFNLRAESTEDGERLQREAQERERRSRRNPKQGTSTIDMKHSKFKGFQFQDGRIVDHAYFDGYAFGDRLLEGVIFEARITKDGDMKVSITPDSKDYFKTLNTKRWLKAAAEFARSYDIFSENADGSGEQLELIPA